jgi:tripartite-type tricarboxylate transporter receptor subunit TctC
VAALVIGLPAAAHAAADPVAGFYHGRTITMIVPSDAGGGEAQYALLVAAHLRDHLPGRPAIVPQYMPGAAGARGASYFYTVAPRDGSVFAAMAPAGPLFQRLRPKASGFRLDFAQLLWLGRVTTTESVLMALAPSGRRTIEDVRRLGAIACARAAADPGALDAGAFAAAAGAAIRIVKGYPGTKAMLAAFASGECNLLSLPWNLWRLSAAALITDGTAVPLAAMARQRIPKAPALPTVAELASQPALRDAVLLLAGPAAIGRSYALAPGVPAARAATLQRAFDAMLADRATADDAKRRGMDFDPASGATVARYVAEALEAPDAVVDRARALIVP